MPPDLKLASANAPVPFHCSSTYGALDAAWVHVAGALDPATAPQLERTLRDAHTRARLVVLDLRELTFIDRAGLDAIIGASRHARHTGRRLVLVRGCPAVYRQFKLSGSIDDVEIADLSPAPPLLQTQRSLVSQSLLATG